MDATGFETFIDRDVYDNDFVTSLLGTDEHFFDTTDFFLDDPLFDTDTAMSETSDDSPSDSEQTRMDRRRLLHFPRRR